MIKYLFLQAGLTIVFFMIWIGTTNLPGGEVGMAPFLLGIFLLIQLTTGILLSLFFRKHLTTANTMLIGMLVYIAIYELGPVGIGSEPMILGIFEKGAKGELNRAFGLIPLVATVFTLIAIEIRERKGAT
ncbi:hypothetical protein [uncultured Algoriphagus sp.]|uniref:hypothetical protein n=1 Tax=uncultured Algoriphagus sp. TaxID=417365 RepID=UPI0030EDB20A|tara:strand:+ start:1614 stop:2003 length:390 start_codon:yes stop_codon:yes gene_type:complete